jgi:hypothetical protein
MRARSTTPCESAHAVVLRYLDEYRNRVLFPVQASLAEIDTQTVVAIEKAVRSRLENPEAMSFGFHEVLDGFPAS